MPDSFVPFDRILASIPPGTRKDQEYASDGSGRDYSYDYEDIQKARRVVEDIEVKNDEHDAMRQRTRREPKPAEWDKVFALGVKVLSTESKDLRVAAWVVEALGHLRGFGGLRDGFSMFRRLQSRYWDTSYPRSDEDPEFRRGPYEFLDSERILPLLIREIPLTFPIGGVPLSYLNRREAERNEKDAADSARGEDYGSPGSTEGKLLLKDWKASIELTPPERLQRVAGEVGSCLVAFAAWEKATDRQSRSLKHAPSVSRIGEALIECARQVKEMLGVTVEGDAGGLALAIRRFEGDRRPAVVVAPKAPGPLASLDYWLDAVPPTIPELRAESEPGFIPEPVAIEAEPLPEPAGFGPESPPEDAETAYRRVREAAAFLRASDPDDPVPYLLIRSLQLGGLFGGDPGEHHPGPARETRKQLRRLAADGDWNEVVDLTEGILSEPEGRGWLDAHRLAIRGLQERGRDRAALACQGLLAAALAQVPALAEAELDDGTAAASAETRAWLATLPGLAKPEPEPEVESEVVDPPPDPIARAEALLRDGRIDAAIRAFSDALDASLGERDRFLATARFARACLEEGHDRMAVSLLEGLGNPTDDLILRAWEGRKFFEETATDLRDALDRIGEDASSDRFARAIARLAQISPVSGLGGPQD